MDSAMVVSTTDTPVTLHQECILTRAEYTVVIGVNGVRNAIRFNKIISIKTFLLLVGK